MKYPSLHCDPTLTGHLVLEFGNGVFAPVFAVAAKPRLLRQHLPLLFQPVRIDGQIPAIVLWIEGKKNW